MAITGATRLASMVAGLKAGEAVGTIFGGIGRESGALMGGARAMRLHEQVVLGGSMLIHGSAGAVHGLLHGGEGAVPGTMNGIAKAVSRHEESVQILRSFS